MRRWILRILICLILGAMTAVAVACGFAIKTPDACCGHSDHGFSLFGDSFAPDEWHVTTRRDLGSTMVISDNRLGDKDFGLAWYLHDQHDRVQRAEAVIPSWSVEHDNDHPITRNETHYERATGWPTYSLAGGFVLSEKRQLLRYFDAISIDELQPVEFETRFLPTRILWDGFALNTIFYATIWCAVFFGFTSAKRFIRIKRGRCPRCGYDLRGQVAEQQSSRIAEQQDSGLPLCGSVALTSVRCPECGWGRRC